MCVEMQGHFGKLLPPTVPLSVQSCCHPVSVGIAGYNKE